MTDRAPAPAARHYAWLAAAFAAFALYGSLVPLEFRPLPWEEAQRRWQEVCSQPVRVESRSDWAANILLFIPLGFLGMAALCADRRRTADWWAVPTAAVCSGFSCLLEFLQLYFPPRTSSLDDIVAESIGAVVGIVLWVAAGRRLTRGARAAWAGATTNTVVATMRQPGSWRWDSIGPLLHNRRACKWGRWTADKMIRFEQCGARCALGIPPRTA